MVTSSGRVGFQRMEIKTLGDRGLRLHPVPPKLELVETEEREQEVTPEKRMKPLDLYVLSGSQGISSAVKTINGMASDSPEAFSTLASLTMSAAEGRSPPLSSEEAFSVLGARRGLVAEAEVDAALRSLLYLYRGVLKHVDEGAAGLGEALQQYTDMSPMAIAAIGQAAQGGAGKLKRDPCVGRLLKLDWSVGVALQSSRCTGLNMPYVRLIFEVAGSDGRAVTKAIEHHYDKFQEFLDAFTEIAAVVDLL